jgi:hypothetical protein
MVLAVGRYLCFTWTVTYFGDSATTALGSVS